MFYNKCKKYFNVRKAILRTYLRKASFYFALLYQYQDKRHAEPIMYDELSKKPSFILNFNALSR